MALLLTVFITLFVVLILTLFFSLGKFILVKMSDLILGFTNSIFLKFWWQKHQQKQDGDSQISFRKKAVHKHLCYVTVTMYAFLN